MKHLLVALYLLEAVLTGCASPGDKTTFTSAQRISKLGARFGFPTAVKSDRNFTLESQFTTMVFSEDSRKLLFNGTLIYMNEPVLKDGRTWWISKADIETVIEPLLTSAKTLAGRNYSKIILDPGHGGRDTGAIGSRNVYEKKVVLDIARRLRKKLEASGVEVQLTRKKDRYLSLADRASKANRQNADVFVSLHLNAARNLDASGIETYVLPVAGSDSTAGNNDSKHHRGNEHDRVNTLLAYHVHKQMLKLLECPDRGIRRARFEVLRMAPCPAVLVECGFVSNYVEEKKFLKSSYRDRIAEALARGLKEYIRKADKPPD
jgi:N-acetylmuramoyl-L-alanine amidase